MTSRAASDPVGIYLTELQRNIASGIAKEHTHRHALQDFIQALDPTIEAFNDPKQIEVGVPDFTIRRKRQAQGFPVGWIETKDIGENLNDVEKSEQLQRYFRLPNLILTDYLEFRWYTDGKIRLSARLAQLGQRRKFLPISAGREQVATLLKEFLRQSALQVVTPGELAKRMADLAHIIRNLLLRSFETERGSGKLQSQYEAFRETLIPDLSPAQFADMYAQTIAYGLFAARCQPGTRRDSFSRASAADLIPKTNPFLRKLFQPVALDLDSRVLPFVDDLVALLRDADIGSIMADFGKRAAKEDPVVHFYEDFLREYDPKVREMRGVYYTPEPVVSYIVRSVDILLKTKFNKPMGLADKDVLILDPACGTGTFLYYVIQHIHQTLSEHGQKGQWNRYVSENLLKRVFGFELLMAPYAVAHLKLGLLLQELGYKFESEERLGIYLTNTLEEAIKRSEAMFSQWIADEANAAADIKRDKPIMVILGNPPYSGHSANRSTVTRIVEAGQSYPVVTGGPLREQQTVVTKTARKRIKVVQKTFIGQLMQDYYFADGRPLGEKNPKWLQDDYVKFIRFGQWRIERTGYGILAYITNHGYLDNPTFRGMRQQLMRAFSEVDVLDLHGNSKKKERAPDGSDDKNVFDIQQGVAIGLFMKQADGKSAVEVGHADLWGSRDAKYNFLGESDVTHTSWQPLASATPSFQFRPQSEDLRAEYEQGWRLPDIFPVSSVGIVTARDSLTVHFTPEEVWATVEDFATLPIEEAREKYHLGPDVQDWTVSRAQSDLNATGPRRSRIVPLLYRPFDIRYTYYTGSSRGFICRPRAEVMRRMLAGTNIGLAVPKRVETQREWCHAFVSRNIVDHVAVSLKTIDYLFPLYEYPTDDEILDLPLDNRASGGVLSDNFLEEIQRTLGLQFANERMSDGAIHGPMDVLAYVYAILHSPGYRKRYGEFLRADFPIVPITHDGKLFVALAEEGRRLVDLHLMDPAVLSGTNFVTRYEQSGDDTVEKIRYAGADLGAGIPTGRVYINAKQYFEGVPPEVWEFRVGGYQVCEKWLKDRKGRQLSSDDIDHYQKIVLAISETIRIMREIDDMIPGWPLP